MKEKDKLTIYEYEEKYTSRENSKKYKRIFALIVFVLGGLTLSALFSVFKDVYDINPYVGYGVGIIELALFVVFFVIPVIRIRKKDKFEINVSAYTARKAQKHNEKVRDILADKIIDVYVNSDCGWYDSLRVKALINARNSDDKQALSVALDEIYGKDVKSASKNIIMRSALKSGAFSAISQKDYTDAMIVTAINLQMIKDIVFLYGFRPSDTKLMKIFSTVLSNSLIAYGLGNVRIGNSVVKTMGDMAKGIPILGSAISVLVDSSVQGLSNATLTAVIGRQTVSYLKREYRLQNILAGVELGETEEEFENTCNELKTVLSNGKNKIA